MLKYLDFVYGVIAAFQKYGERFPALWMVAMQIAAKFKEGLDIASGKTTLTGTPMKFGVSRDKMLSMLKTHEHSIEITADEEAAEKKLKQMLSKHAAKNLRGTMDPNLKAIGDGTLLRALFAFMQANPQLMTLILSLLGIKMPGAATGPQV